MMPYHFLSRSRFLQKPPLQRLSAVTLSGLILLTLQGCTSAAKRSQTAFSQALQHQQQSRIGVTGSSKIRMMQTAEQEDADALKVAQMLYKARLSGDQFSGSQLSRSQPSGNQSSGSQRLSEQPSPLHTAPLSSSEQYTLKLQYQPGQQHPSPMQKRYLRQFLDSLPGSTPHLQLRCITSTAGDRFEERFENSHQALQRCHSLGIHLQTLGVQSVARLSPNGTAHSVELSLPTVADRVQE